MISKSVHIVFQVLNFLRNSPSVSCKLLPIDKLILLTLASHKGAHGIFPMQETLAQELELSLRYVKNRLKYLEANGLIFVEKISRKNYYHLPFLSTIGDPQITHDENIGDPQITSQVIYRSPHRGSTDATNNKVSNKLNKTERSRTKRGTPLSVDFLPNKDACKRAEESGLTEEEANEEFDKFLLYYLAKNKTEENWNHVLERWFIRAGEYKRKQGTVVKKEKEVKEVKSTVPWFNPESERGAMPVAKLLNGLAEQAKSRLNGKGAPNNELGRKEKGKGTSVF